MITSRNSANALSLILACAIMMFSLLEPAHAQTKRSVYAKILAIDTTDEGEIRAAASSPYCSMMKIGMKGVVVKRNDKEEKIDIDTRVGTALVLKVFSDSLVAFSISLNSAYQNKGVAVGDLLSIDVQDTLFKPDHFTGHLLSQYLSFQNANRGDFYTYGNLLRQYQKDPDGTERALLKLMTDDLRDFYKDMPEVFDIESLSNKAEKGRYIGRSAKDVFANLQESDVEAFLGFVVSYPGKYIGHEFKLNETFATWLINNAPFGGFEVLRLYHQTGRDSLAFAKKLKSIPGLLQEKDLSNNIGLFASNNRYWSDELALDEFTAARWYSFVSGDYDGAGMVSLIRAEMLHNNNQYGAAIPYCLESERFFTRSKNYDRVLDALSKASYCQYTIDSYDSSWQTLQRVRQILMQYPDKLEASSLASNWRKYFEYNAYTYNRAGRFNEALLYIDSAIAYTSQQDVQVVASFLAYDYNLRGKIYKNRQLYEKALSSIDSSIILYKLDNDFKSVGITGNDRAVVLFRQGKYTESNNLLKLTIALFEGEEDYDNAGYGYSQMGQNFWNLNEYDSAIASHKKAINYRQRAANKSGEAFSWSQLGTLYQRAGLKPQALMALDSASNLYAQVNDRAEMANILSEAGKVYENDKEIAKAETYYRRAAHALAELGNKAGYADALFNLGLLVYEEKPEEAFRYMDSCQRLSLAAGLNAQAAYAMMNMGGLRKNQGDIAGGKQWYASAKKIVEEVNEPHATAQYYRNLGFDAEWSLDLDSAIRCFSLAKQIFDSTDQEMAVKMTSRIAGNLQSMGEFSRAEAMIDEVMEEARKRNYVLELGNAFQAKAWVLLQQGLTENGLPLADSAFKYFSQSGNQNSLAGLAALRGDFNRKMFNFKESYRWYAAADSVFAASGNAWYKSSGMINFIVLYYYQGDYRKSLDYTFRAIKERPFLLEDATYVELQACLAENYYYLKQYDSANFYIDKYLPLAQQKKLNRSAAWLSLMKGRILVDQQGFAKAIPYLQLCTSKESAKNDLNIYQQALAYLGMAHSGAKNSDSARRYFDMAVQAARNFELPSFSWEALYLSGLDAYNGGDFAKAIPLFKEAVSLVNRQAGNLYGGEEASKLFKQHSTKADLYFKLMSALTKTGQKEEAWQYANLSQAAAVTDLAGGFAVDANDTEKQKALQLAQSKFETIQSVGQALQESKKDSASKAGQIAVLEKKKAIAEAEYLNYIEQLKKNYSELGTYFANQVNPENFRNLHTYLPEDMAMLMYVINDKELMIFWATQDKTGIVTGTIPDNFFQTTEAWINALKNPNRPANAGPLVLRTQIGKTPNKSKPTIGVTEGADQLYQLLIAPVLPEISNRKAWCIIPNGRLTHLPFHALGTATEGKKFEYLAASRNIFYTNKPDQLFLPWNRRNKQSFAALGNPDQSLASAGEEVSEIAKVYPTATVYREGAATLDKATSSLESMHYVHFATHGVLAYPDFDSSYLVFAPGPGQPNGGRLTLYDIRRLNIKGCDLVTLSACETAVSAEVGKGWYVSPANAFLLNKVRSVLASLWEVDDRSTSMLMQRFYKHLQTMPKADALRQAMADVSAVPEFEHPFYWAAFVLYGDWQ